MSITDNRPRPYDLGDPAEIRRLLRECEGYLRTCKLNHHGTDSEGRKFATDALASLAGRVPEVFPVSVSAVTERNNG